MTGTFTVRVSKVMDVVKINAKTFPDANFREYVKQFDLTDNNALNQAELDQVTEIDVAGKKIANLTGIAYFTSLASLNCGNNVSAQTRHVRSQENNSRILGDQGIRSSMVKRIPRVL